MIKENTIGILIWGIREWNTDMSHTWTGVGGTICEKLVENFVMWKPWGVGNSLDIRGMKIDMEEEKECWKSITKKES